MRDLALHVLDIIENAITAAAEKIQVEVRADKEKDMLLLRIKDNGHGMDDETRRKALDPFFTKKPGKRVGLGLPLLAQAAREAGGELSIEVKEETCITALFTLSHPDRKPIGDIAGTLHLLRAVHPGIDFHLDYQVDEKILCSGISPKAK